MGSRVWRPPSCSGSTSAPDRGVFAHHLSGTMKVLFLLAVAQVVAAHLRVKLHQEQDPCAGCDTDAAVAYQTCAMTYGNPCAELNDQNLTSTEPGAKQDIACCMARKKHLKCLECKAMDCQYA